MRIGVDLGGTKIEVAVLGPNSEMLLRERTATPAGDYNATVRAIRDMILSAEAKLGIKGTVGLATPGAISPKTGLIKNSNSTALIGHPLDRDLARLLNRPVRIANDANCFALSESVDGAAAGHSLVFGIIVGTGCGGGIAFDRRVWTGPNAIAGEWGHNPLPWPKAELGDAPGPQCPCGKYGCIETFLSGTAIALDYERHTSTRKPGEEVVASVAYDSAAAKVMDLYYDRFARALAAVLNVLDPDAVVIGGGASNNPALYEELPRRLPAYVFSDAISTPILPNKHGDSSGVRGAAWLWPEL